MLYSSSDIGTNGHYVCATFVNHQIFLNDDASVCKTSKRYVQQNGVLFAVGTNDQNISLQDHLY